uniref:Uncharacterized protein n=1 Tax=Oryza rufipogon TaxID=4529 RepID=A0A0E0NRS1_ORYRU
MGFVVQLVGLGTDGPSLLGASATLTVLGLGELASASTARASSVAYRVQISRLCGAAGELPRLASLCLREVLLVQGDRRRLLGAKPDAAAAGVRRDGGGATGAQPRPGHAARPLAGRRAGRLGLADDVLDVLALASRQCRRCSPAPEAEQALKASVLSLIQEIEPRHRRRTSGAQSLSI